MNNVDEMKAAAENLRFVSSNAQTTKELAQLKEAILEARRTAQNPDLTPAAQHKAYEKAKKSVIDEFVGGIKPLQEYYDRTVLEIKASAHRKLAERLPEPSIEAQTAFERRLNDAKVAVLTSHEPRKALVALANSITEPAIASQFASELPALIAQAVQRTSGQQQRELQGELAGLYADVTERSFTPHQLEARELLSEVERMEGRSLYANPYLESLVRDAIGAEWLPIFKDPINYTPTDDEAGEVQADNPLSAAEEEVRRNPSPQNFAAYNQLKREVEAAADAGTNVE